MYGYINAFTICFQKIQSIQEKHLCELTFCDGVDTFN